MGKCHMVRDKESAAKSAYKRRAFTERSPPESTQMRQMWELPPTSPIGECTCTHGYVCTNVHAQIRMYICARAFAPGRRLVALEIIGEFIANFHLPESVPDYQLPEADVSEHRATYIN